MSGHESNVVGSCDVPPTVQQSRKVILSRERLGRIGNWTVWLGGGVWYTAFGLFLANLTPFANHREFAQWALRWHPIEWMLALGVLGLFLARILYGFGFPKDDRKLPDAYIFLSGTSHDLWRVPLMFIFIAISLATLFIALGFPLFIGMLFLYVFGGR